MIVSVDPASPVPLFEQLRSQIELLIVCGQLPVGSQLPAIRHLATDLGLARGTVAKVYESLARDGLVEASGRNGTVVTAAARADGPTAAFTHAVEQLAMVATQLQLPVEHVQQAVAESMERIGRSTSPFGTG